MGQWINFLSEIRNVLPWVSFVAGLGGSLHCVGMCGGLVTATCSRGEDVFKYQIGRLLGYLVLGLLASIFGLIVDLKLNAPQISVYSGIFIGGLFIYWGIKSFQGKKAEIPTPRFLSHFYQKLWGRFVRPNHGLSRSFYVGLISIFLPCGLLYGVILGAIALNTHFEILVSLFFFWLGTIPSMVIAPSIMQKILTPLKSKLPKTFAVSLILLGLVTISLRVARLNSERISKNEVKSEEGRSCH